MNALKGVFSSSEALDSQVSKLASKVRGLCGATVPVVRCTITVEAAARRRSLTESPYLPQTHHPRQVPNGALMIFDPTSASQSFDMALATALAEARDE